MSNIERLSVTETAAIIRRKLAAEFPKTKFYVRSQSYSGGASIDIYFDGSDGFVTPTVCHCSGGPTGLQRPGDRCTVCNYFPQWERKIKPGQPTLKQVNKVVALFAGRGFDGMIDLAYSIEAYLDKQGNVVGTRSSGTGSHGSVPAWDDPIKTERVVSFGSNYVSVHDELPYDVRSKVV